MITYSKRDFFYKDSCHKLWTIRAYKNNNLIVTITNSDLQEESISLTESIGSGDDIVFGRCEPSRFEFTVHNVIESLKNCILTVDLILDHDLSAPFRVGTYYVDSDRPTANRDFRKVVCYDMAGKLGEKDVNDWYDSLTFPMTLKQFRDSFFSYVGIIQQTITLINDSVTIYKGLNDEEDGSSRSIKNSSITAMTVLNAICELNGCFGHINRNNVFVYVYLPVITKGLYPANDLFPANDLYPADDVVNGTFHPHNYISCDYEDYEVKQIDDVIIYSDDEEDEIRVNPNATNPYCIESNFLLYKMPTTQLQTIATNLLSKINYIFYSSCNIDCVCDLCIEVGDSFVFNDKYNQVYSYVLTRSMSGLQVLKDNIQSSGNEDRSKNYNNLNSKINRTASKAESDSANNREYTDEAEASAKAYSDTITAEAITTTKLYADTITANAINTTKLYADTVGANAVTTTKLYADEIVANAITTTELYADQIGSETYRVSKIYADQIGTEAQRVSKLYADDIVANAITTTELYADSIGSEAERVSKLYADGIVANAITTVELYADSIGTNTLSAAEIYADQIGSEAERVSKLYADSVVADKVTASEVSSTYATIASLNSTNATISQLNSELVTTNQVLATKATITSLEAVDAKFYTLNADYITSGTVSADRLSADAIAGKLTGKSVYCADVHASSGDFGFISCSAGSTCGREEIATKDWVTANFVAK